MNDSPFTTDREDLPRVSPASLPKSLRHVLPGEILEDARSLAAFLRSVVFLRAVAADHDADPDMDFSAFQGLALVLNLLEDKLDIAAGVYRFPYVGGAEDSQLVAREE